MAQVTITARVDEEDKINFDAFCAAVGVSVSAAINDLIKMALRENRLPSETSQPQDPFFQPANQAYVLKSVQELRAGKGKVHDLIEVGDE